VKLVSIKENHLFQKVYAKGKKAVGNYAAVYVLTDIHAQKLKRAHPLKIVVNRVGITVTKKAGGAVQRNRVKRVIREAYRQLYKEYDIRCGKLVVISARDAALSAGMNRVKDDLKKSFIRLNMLFDKKSEGNPEISADKYVSTESSEIISKSERDFGGAANAGDNRL